MSNEFESLTIAAQKMTGVGVVTSVGSGIAHKADVLSDLVSNVEAKTSISCIVGIAFAVVGYFTSLYFQFRRDKHELMRNKIVERLNLRKGEGEGL